jgi:hypothetical protein
MTINRRTRAAAVALLTAAMAAPAAPAAAKGGDVVLRRDGSKAVPFVSDPAPTPADGFDWGDAGIGAGVATTLMLGATGALAARSRRPAGRVHLRVGNS